VRLIYLAARYSRRLELCSYRGQLEDLGHIVTARWLQGGHQIDDQGRNIGVAGEKAVEDGSPLAGKFAQDDMDDVARAQVVIAFTEFPGAGGRARGGRHVELGLALAWGRDVAVVGPRENVFCWLPRIQHFEDWGPEVGRWLGATEEQLDQAGWRPVG